MIKNEELISKFCSYFDSRIKEIENLNNRLYQKILIVTLMDTLSIAWTRGSEKRNKLRFCKLIRECIKWEGSDRISIPMLNYRLVKRSNLLNDKITALFNNYKEERIYRIDTDPFYSDFIENILITKEEENLLKDTRHTELLYKYRNNLIHEFREPGHGMEISNDNESPYYYLMLNLRTNVETWELVYPKLFLIKLAKTALISLKHNLLEKDLNPYSFFKFGTPW